ncbi:uncharacterized protein LOC122884276 [Siniperca chuatsi]|uniref:uncharacterized protein LOC122884276 n=1 Tax=Siniperca chuatsi TaxID=119488 RepID=UPI001CE13049|nr:uncharacterized protein LOC122884276 [Siniperca chuatsi]
MTAEMANENEALHRKISELQHQLEVLQLRTYFGIQRLAGSDEDIRFYTRFASYKHFQAFWKLVEPAPRLPLLTALSSLNQHRPNTFSQKPPPIEVLLLFVMHLSVGLPLRDLAERFGIHHTTASRIIATWMHFLYNLLGTKCLWIPGGSVRAHLPPEFSAFPDTQVVLDCIEIFYQTPSSLLLQRSISDREIFKLSGIVNLLTPDMAIMVDKGFLVDNLALCKVYQPVFLSRNAQMSREDVRQT